MSIFLSLEAECKPPSPPLRAHAVCAWRVVDVGPRQVSLVTPAVFGAPVMSTMFTPEVLPQLRLVVAMLEQKERQTS